MLLLVYEPFWFGLLEPPAMQPCRARAQPAFALGGDVSSHQLWVLVLLVQICAPLLQQPTAASGCPGLGLSLMFAMLLPPACAAERGFEVH